MSSKRLTKFSCRPKRQRWLHRWQQSSMSHKILRQLRNSLQSVSGSRKIKRVKERVRVSKRDKTRTPASPSRTPGRGTAQTHPVHAVTTIISSLIKLGSALPPSPAPTSTRSSPSQKRRIKIENQTNSTLLTTTCFSTQCMAEVTCMRTKYIQK